MCIDCKLSLRLCEPLGGFGRKDLCHGRFKHQKGNFNGSRACVCSIPWLSKDDELVTHTPTVTKSPHYQCEDASRGQTVTL